MANDSAVKLSKNLLRMKFMQRGLDAEIKKQLEEEEKKIISDEHWYLDLPDLKAKESFIIEENSFVPCEDLIYGRMSFKGFNPEVEKFIQVLNTMSQKEQEADEDLVRMETDITDEEMANRYNRLVENIRKKFAKKRDRSVLHDEDASETTEKNNKKLFLKPQD
ncbi:M-phase phosphoprotein 6 [Arapaima gigas]